jgi:uncharacterized protein (DUF1330 family)
MPKGYIIARVSVADPVRYADYAKLSTEAIRKYNGRPIVRGGKHEALEGDARPRNVVIEFDSYDQAHTFYYSPEYAAARAVRQPVSTGEFLLVEGVD